MIGPESSVTKSATTLLWGGISVADFHKEQEQFTISF